MTITADTFAAALTAALPGDTLKLSAAFPAMRFKAADAPDNLTLDATDATFAGLWYFTEPRWLKIKGGTWAGLRCDRAEGVAVEAARFIGDGTGIGVMINGGAGVRVTDTVFCDLRNGVSLIKVEGFEVARCGFEAMRSDGVQAGESRDGRITDNRFHGTRITGTEHPDAVQIWSKATSPPTAGITISGNRVMGATQGICGFNHGDNGGFDRITIRDNDVCGGYPHAIALYGGRDCIIRDNRVSTYPGSKFRATINAIGCERLSRTGNRVEAGAGKPAVIDPA